MLLNTCGAYLRGSGRDVPTPPARPPAARCW